MHRFAPALVLALVGAATGCGSSHDNGVSDAEASRAAQIVESQIAAASFKPHAPESAMERSCASLIQARASRSGDELAGRTHRRTTKYEASDVVIDGITRKNQTTAKIPQIYYEVPLHYTVNPEDGASEVTHETCRLDESQEAVDIR